MVSRSAIITLSFSNGLLLEPSEGSIRLMTKFSHQIPQLIFKFLRTTHDRVQNKPDSDGQHSRQHQRRGKDRRWKPRHKPGFEELDGDGDSWNETEGNEE